MPFKYQSKNNRFRQSATNILTLLTIYLFVLSAGCATESQPEISSAARPGGDEVVSESGQVAFPVSEKIPVEDIPDVWQQSPHGNTFVQGEGGKNSDCARCHAPVEFIPTMDDLPESCFTCKFTVEPPPPVIPEEAWSHVDCQVCHEVKKGVVNQEIAWLEIAAIGEYSTPASSTDLCLKCHTGSGVEGHLDIGIGGVHSEITCTNCHDPHATTADCGSAGCHDGLPMEGETGHDADHQNLACSACHDGSALEVDVDDDGIWRTYLTIETGGTVTVRPFTSHNIVREVSCLRCHFPGNPWGIAETVE